MILKDKRIGGRKEQFEGGEEFDHEGIGEQEFVDR